MELPNVGKQCDFKECRKLGKIPNPQSDLHSDFLPYSCKGCKKNFCFEHQTCQSHKCISAVQAKDRAIPQCPLCQAFLHVYGSEAGQDVNFIVDQHLASKCTKYIQPKSSKSYRCAFEGCKRANFHEMKCGECKGNYCIEHRHHFIHVGKDKIKKDNLKRSFCMLV